MTKEPPGGARLSNDSKIVFKILVSDPVDIVDNEISIYEYHNYQLTEPRLDTCRIGSANYLAAYNWLIKKYLARRGDNIAYVRQKLVDILQELESHHLIRRSPNQLRQTFKLVERNKDDRKT